MTQLTTKDTNKGSEQKEEKLAMVAKLRGTAKIIPLLQEIGSFASSSACNDKGLKLLQYLSWLLGYYYSYGNNRKQEISQSLMKIYNHLFMARYATRLYGLPVSLEGFITGSWVNEDWKDKRIHKLGKLSALSMCLYHPCEHIAYCQWVAPKLLKVDAEKWSAWSCRFWAMYLLSESMQCILQLRELGDRHNNNDNKEHKLAYIKQRKMIQLQLVRNIFYGLPVINWSLPHWETDPWLPKTFVNSLCTAESIVCIIQSIIARR